MMKEEINRFDKFLTDRELSFDPVIDVKIKEASKVFAEQEGIDSDCPNHVKESMDLLREELSDDQ